MKRIARSILKCATLILLASSACPSASYAQQHWQLINTPPGLKIFAPYFINRNYGFIYTEGYTDALGPGGQTDPPGIYRTLDGGIHWSAMDIGEIAQQQYAVLLQMRFDSPAHGYVIGSVCDALTGYKGGLYETLDSGAHWTRISPVGMSFQALCISDSFVFLKKLRGGFPDTLVTFNAKSKSFRQERLNLGVTISSNGGPFVFSYHGNGGVRSSDEGKTWIAIPPTYEAWSSYIFNGTTAVIRAAELTGLGHSLIQRSLDGGANWDSHAFVYSPYMQVGDLDGDGCTAYVRETLQGPDSALLRSTDFGASWEPVGGPVHSCDSRCLSVTDHGAVVYATEDNNAIYHQFDSFFTPITKLWRTTDGGDGAFNHVFGPEILSDVIPSGPMCHESTAAIKLNYNSCFVDLSIDSITLGSADSTFSLDKLPVFPTVLNGQSSASFTVRFTPHRPGTFKNFVHVHLSVPGQTATLDTVLPISAIGTAVPPALMSNVSSLDFGAINTCVGNADTSIVFVNPGCGPDTITSASLSGTSFSQIQDTLPIVVLPNDSIALHYRFTASDTGSFRSLAAIHVHSMGLAEQLEFVLNGRGIQGSGILNIGATKLQAGKFSFCEGDTTLQDTLWNSGCDTMILSNVHFVGDPTFSIINTTKDSLLLPGSSSIFHFTFAPRTKGSHVAQLIFHVRNKHNDTGYDTTLTLSGFGLNGAVTFSADSALRDFGALYRCESRDTTIELFNSGCDTLRVDSAVISNAAFSSITTFPTLVLPNSATPIRLRLAPAVDSVSGSITFYAANGRTIAIPLSAQFIPRNNLRLSLSKPQVAKNGESVTYNVMLTGDVRPKSSYLKSLAFDLIHNDDLLSYVGASGAGVTVTRSPRANDMITEYFSVSPVSSSDTIAAITFKAHLTDSTTTSLTLLNLGLEVLPNLPVDCIASIDSASSSFTYVYSQCGEDLIQKAMRHVPIQIASISPNPARDEILINFGGAPRDVSIVICDVLGKVVARGFSTSSSTRINLKGVENGSYIMRCTSDGFVETRKISVLR